MPEYKINLKWGKEQYKDIEINTTEPPMVFKAQLFALTNVPPERQKIMFKGHILSDDSWANFEANIKNGITFMMMGSADQLLETPKVETKFMEDLNESQLAVALDLPVGLKNLGNTCYLNAVLQCMKSVPELCSTLGKYKESSKNRNNADMTHNLVIALGSTYESMDKHKISYPPIMLLQYLHTLCPQFATTTNEGVYMQQDANECWVELMRMLQQKLPPSPISAPNDAQSIYTNFIDQYFSGQFSSVMKCEECPEESETKGSESFLQLSCFISQDVKYLQTGIKLRLEEKLTKYSPTLKRDANYNKISKISRLPAYLCVQYVRFFYKEKDKVNAKILKDVKFQTTLDLFELCTNDLQQKLIPMREKFRIVDEKQAYEHKQALKKLIDSSDPKATQNNNQQLLSSTATNNTNYESYSFEGDIGSNNSGLYELIAVLTHKGRSSNSGHYVGWCKNSKTSQWLMFDDDNVAQVTEEDILKLSGGGDWHTSYLLLYGPRKLDLNYYNEAIKAKQQSNETPLVKSDIESTIKNNDKK